MAVGLLLLFATAGGAQTHEFEVRLDALARIAERTSAALVAYDDSVKRASRMLDTAFRGGPTVLADGSLLHQTRSSAPRIVDSIAAIIGAARSNIAGYTFVARVERRRSWQGVRDTTSEHVLSIMQPNRAELRTWRGAVDSVTIGSSLAHALSYAAFSASGSAFFAWAGNTVPGGELTKSDWAEQRLLLVSTRTAVGSRCYQGDLEACKHSLLIERAADPIMEWHDSTTRRQLVRRNGALARRIDVVATRQCEAGADSSCVRLLRAFPESHFREPAAVALRSAILRHALAIGGEGAIERLLTASPEPAARLASASGMPIDTLLRGWQRRVHDTHAPSEDLSVGITLMALAWATGLGALSLRSSRWR
ncbi:MAG: hypothetical protein ACREOK_01215 [Gemmatimonadaceae bacterium]